MTTPLFFGCWNCPGHELRTPGGGMTTLPPAKAYMLACGLDSLFAPKRKRSGQIVFGSAPPRDWEHRDAAECPQGQFLRHSWLGYTLIQWWDRCQGDMRGACNSTVLLEGEHTSEEMLAALREHFPHVVANLERAGVQLVDVTEQLHAKGGAT